MKLNNQNYPYPILVNGSTDYIDCHFKIIMEEEPKEIDNQIIISLKYDLKADGLNKLINSGLVSVVSQVFCKSTSYRKLFTFNNNKLILKINKSELGDKVEINSFIVANKPIDNFLLDEFNKNYFPVGCKIQKGDKLGIGEMISFSLQSYDSLRPIASVILIRPNYETDAKPVDVDLSGDKVIIYLNDSVFNKYITLREYPDLRLYLSTMIVLPAIMEALNELKSVYGEEDNRRWILSFKKVLSQLDVDIISTDYSLYCIANMIIKNGLESSLIALEQFYNIDGKDS